MNLSASSHAPDIPEGFSPLAFASAFTRTLDVRYYEARREGRRVVGLRIEPQHCHAQGGAHGGFLLALADFALSYGTWRTGDLPPRMTLHLNADFMRPVAEGAWLEVEVDVKKSSEGLVFADCLMRADGRTAVRASGVFRPMRRPTEQDAADPSLVGTREDA